MTGVFSPEHRFREEWTAKYIYTGFLHVQDQIFKTAEPLPTPDGNNASGSIADPTEKAAA